MNQRLKSGEACRPADSQTARPQDHILCQPRETWLDTLWFVLLTPVVVLIVVPSFLLGLLRDGTRSLLRRATRR